jgi:hypothetical protein
MCGNRRPNRPTSSYRKTTVRGPFSGGDEGFETSALRDDHGDLDGERTRPPAVEQVVEAVAFLRRWRPT